MFLQKPPVKKISYYKFFFIDKLIFIDITSSSIGLIKFNTSKYFKRTIKDLEKIQENYTFAKTSNNVSHFFSAKSIAHRKASTVSLFTR